MILSGRVKENYNIYSVVLWEVKKKKKLMLLTFRMGHSLKLTDSAEM